MGFTRVKYYVISLGYTGGWYMFIQATRICIVYFYSELSTEPYKGYGFVSDVSVYPDAQIERRPILSGALFPP